MHLSGDSRREQQPRIAFLFPGQGSQFPTMGQTLYQHHATVRQMIDRASDLTGLDLRAAMFSTDGAALRDTAVAQVSIFALSTAIATTLIEMGIRPWAVAGHSLGEYSALAVAGCLSWDAALRLVHERGKAMSRASSATAGTMAAITGLSLDEVEALCASLSERGCVVVANQNAPTQIVVSGEVALVNEVAATAETAGAGIYPLEVAGAFHSPLMAAAEKEYARFVTEVPLHKPSILMVSSITGRIMPEPEEYRELLKRQITLPVRWVSTVETLVKTGADLFVEVGPGRVLTGLVRKIHRSARIMTVGEQSELDEFMRLVRQTVTA